MSETRSIECEWSAWYNGQPPRDDPDLHVAGRCGLPSGSIKIRLEPGNEGVVDDPNLFVLQCTAEVPEIGTDDWVDREVSWRGDVGSQIEFVRIQGDLSAKVKVETVV
jgi:hypothetical protein